MCSTVLYNRNTVLIHVYRQAPIRIRDRESQNMANIAKVVEHMIQKTKKRWQPVLEYLLHRDMATKLSQR